RAHLLRLRIHQRGHGQRAAPGCRSAATVGQLRGNIDGDPAGELRYPHVPLLASEARRLVMRNALALTAIILFCSSSAWADGSFAGRTRFDLDRTEIQT